MADWRECLSPGLSPAGSARSHRSCGSTPGAATPPLGGTPPLSAQASARSARSNASARSGCSGRSPAAGGYPPSHSSHSGLSAHRDAYVTPESSARYSEFASVHDSASARTATTDFGGQQEELVSHRSRHGAYNAAFDAFGGFGAASSSSMVPEGTGEAASAATGSAPAKGSVDPVKVFSAARHGRHKDVEASLKTGYEPNWADQFGNSLFHVACQNGNKRIAKLAIKYGGDMDAQNKKGNTGLHFLFAYGYPDIGEYFIEKGADSAVKNESGLGVREGLK